MQVIVRRSNRLKSRTRGGDGHTQGTRIEWDLSQDEVAEILAKGSLEDRHTECLVHALRKHITNGRR